MTDNDELDPKNQIVIFADGNVNVNVRIDGQTVWLTQKGMAQLYEVSVKTINEHLSNIYQEGELIDIQTIRKFRIVNSEGSNQVVRNLDHYNLEAILAVGYRVRSGRGTQFRKWATSRLSELLIKGFTMDDWRIKEGRSIGQDYFDELLERIRDIRASERLFYLKITDIYATSADYDPKSESANRFFATVQNRLHFAIHGMTAAELIAKRADATKQNMGLTTWRNAPNGPVRAGDVEVAKNYLTESELRELNRIVSMYLDYAEDQAHRHTQMTMAEWETKLSEFLRFNEREILQNAGKVSHELAQALAREEFEKFDRARIQELSSQESDFDRFVKDLGKDHWLDKE